MYDRKKIDDQRSVFRRVFPSKNALRTKRPVFYSPGEFTGRRSETHLHKRKVEILRFRAKRELSSNLPPKRKNRPEDWSAENFENGGVFPLNENFPEKQPLCRGMSFGEYEEICKSLSRFAMKIAQKSKARNRTCQDPGIAVS